MRKTRENDKTFFVSNLTKEDEKSFLEMGVSKGLVAKLFSAEIIQDSKSVKCYAIRNILHDYELFTFLQGAPKNLMSSGFVQLGLDERPKSCCVFWSMQDLLAYDILRKTSPLSLPSSADCYVICNPQSFIDTVVETDEYENIYLFLPNSDFGEAMTLTFKARNEKHVKNCSVYFGKYDNIYDYYLKTRKKKER